MARKFVLGYFPNTTQTNGYVNDRGQSVAVAFRFIAPPDMTVAVEDALLAAVGAVRRNPGQNVACPAEGFKSRTLEFIREGIVNGIFLRNSVSVAVNTRANIITAASAIRGNLTGLTPNFPVTCIRLHGEEYSNIIEVLRPPATTYTVGTNSRGTNPQQLVYSFVMSYNSDALFGSPGTIARVPFKMNTDLIANNAPALPTNLGVAGATCIGDLAESGVCPGRERREPRRYILTIGVTDFDGTGETTERKEVPVSSSLAADILQCGTDLATLASTLCIEYRGESYDRYHNLLP